MTTHDAYEYALMLVAWFESQEVAEIRSTRTAVPGQVVVDREEYEALKAENERLRGICERLRDDNIALVDGMSALSPDPSTETPV
jgi:hypothetical protein